MFLNQVRTLVAHLWENDGEPMSVTAQYLDSVNVPPPATLPALVGAGRACAITRSTTCFRACPITRWARRIGGSAASSTTGSIYHEFQPSRSFAAGRPAHPEQLARARRAHGFSTSLRRRARPCSSRTIVLLRRDFSSFSHDLRDRR